MNVNRIIHIAKTDAGTEPVALADFKAFAKHEWAATEAWEIAENDLDTDLLQAAREVIEAWIRQEVLVKDYVVTAELFDTFVLPGGTIIGTVTAADTDDNALEPTITGREVSGVTGVVVFTYQVGMETVPQAIKYAIMSQALFMYDNRFSPEVSQQAVKYLAGFIDYANY